VKTSILKGDLNMAGSTGERPFSDIIGRALYKF